MDQHLKQRLLGTAVIVSLVVIFVPMLFTEEVEESDEQEWQIPTAPKQFENNIIPLPTKPLAIEAAPSETDATPPSDSDASTLELRESAPEPAKQESPRPQQAPSEPAEPGATSRPKPQSGKKPRPAQPESTTGKKSSFSAWVIQVGSFSRKKNALVFRTKLRAAGFTAFIEPLSAQSGTMYRVRVGPELDKKRAADKLAQLKKQFKLRGIIVPYSSPAGSDSSSLIPDS
jgi:DedD protein